MHAWSIIISQNFPNVNYIQSTTDVKHAWSNYICLRFGCMLQFYRSPGKRGSHFLPSSPLFSPKDKGDVILSTTCWCIMLAFLLAMSCAFGPLQVLKMYGVPYLVIYIIRKPTTTN